MLLVIVDEVHERDEDTDLLLLVVRKFLRTTKTLTKVILMSATADAGKFAQYFNSPVLGDYPNESDRPYRNAPIIEVDPGEPYSVRVYYNEALQQLGVSSYFFNFYILEFIIKHNPIVFSFFLQLRTPLMIAIPRSTSSSMKQLLD